jgi:hypothetical protein
MNDALQVIARHHPNLWRHIPTGEIHTVVWANPREVVAVADSSAWLGCAWQFIREFEAEPEA